MVALPNALHTEVTEAAIARVLEAMELSAGVVHPDLELRYLPVTNAVDRLAASGKIGRVLTAKVGLSCNWGYDGGDWNQDVEGDGLFLFLACWYLDVLDKIIKAEPIEANVVGGRGMNGSLLDYGWASLRYNNGVLGQFDFNLLSGQDAEITLNVCGEDGEVAADLQRGVWRWRQHSGSWHEENTPCSEPVHGFAGMRESITAFISAITKGNGDDNVSVCRRVHQTAMLCHEQDMAIRS